MQCGMHVGGETGQHCPLPFRSPFAKEDSGPAGWSGVSWAAGGPGAYGLWRFYAGWRCREPQFPKLDGNLRSVSATATRRPRFARGFNENRPANLPQKAEKAGSQCLVPRLWEFRFHHFDGTSSLTETSRKQRMNEPKTTSQMTTRKDARLERHPDAGIQARRGLAPIPDREEER